MTTGHSPSNPERNPAGTGQDSQSAFGAVNDADLDFGTPALDPDAESFYSTDGFAEQVEATTDDRLTPDGLFATHQPTQPAQQQPVRQQHVSQQPVQPVPAPQPVQQTVAPMPAPPVQAAPGPFGNAPAEVLDFTNPTTTPPAPAAAGKKKRRGLVAAAAALTLTVLGGSAYAAYQFGIFGATGDQPSAVVPDTAFAYAAIDFNPSAKEKLGAYQLAKKFPSANITSKDTLKDDVLAALISDELGNLNYTTDIKPWIGDRAAVAALPAPGTEDGVTPLVVLAVTDPDKAAAALDKAQTAPPGIEDPAAGAPADTPADTGFTYGFKDDYVLISDNQKELDAALAAETGLDENTVFTRDTDALGGDQFARAWVDLKSLVAAIPADAKADLPPTLADRFTGSLALGAHADADYLEIVGKTFGLDTAGAATSKVALTDTLPDDASLAIEVTSLGDSLASAWESYKDADMFGIDESATAAGFNLPADLQHLFGTDFTAAAKFAEQIDAAFNATADDPAASKDLAQRLAATSGEDLLVTDTDTGYAAATNQNWLDHGVNRTGTLTKNPTFTKAVPHAADATAFAYINIADFLGLIGGAAEEPDLAALQAFGFSMTNNGDHGQFTVRLTTK